MPHLITIDGLLDPADQLFAKVDGDLFIRRQVNVGVHSQEVVALPLASILSCECSSRDCYRCRLLAVDVVVLPSVHHDCSFNYDRNNSYPLL